MKFVVELHVVCCDSMCFITFDNYLVHYWCANSMFFSSFFVAFHTRLVALDQLPFQVGVKMGLDFVFSSLKTLEVKRRVTEL